MKPNRIFLSPPHMGGEELRLIEEAFESNSIAPLGPMVDAFEREFAEKVGIAHAVAVSSGTAAMHLALDLLGVGPGDEVLAQPNWGDTGLLFAEEWKKGAIPPLWDGRAAERIAGHLEKLLGGLPRFWFDISQSY